MGSIDGYKYPDRDVEEMLEIAEVIVNQHSGIVTSKEKFADDLGHSSSKSGTFYTKLADARKFGILPSRGLEANELAYELANPKDDDHKQDALFRMFRNVPILDELYEHLRGDSPPSDFWRIISEITDAEPADAKESSERLEELYKEMLLYEKSDDQNENTESVSDSLEEVAESDQSPTVTPSTGGVYIQVGDNSLTLDSVSVMNLRLARTMIEQMEEQLKQSNSENMSGDSDDQNTSLGSFSN